LRNKLREADIEYRVAKNTLLRRAAEDTHVAGIKDSFVGPSAIALSYQDPVAPAKVLTEFAKSNDQLGIKMGVLDSKALSYDDIKSLSSLPDRDVLLGQLLSVMNAVPTGLVRLLSEIPRRMLNVLQAIKDQKDAA
jgi:large subunit ribosomal protein L10